MALRHSLDELREYLGMCHPETLRDAIHCWMSVVGVTVGELDGVAAQLRATAANYRTASAMTPTIDFTAYGLSTQTQRDIYTAAAEIMEKIADLYSGMSGKYEKFYRLAAEVADSDFEEDASVQIVISVVDDYLSAVESARSVAAELAQQSGLSVEYAIRITERLKDTLHAWEASDKGGWLDSLRNQLFGGIAAIIVPLLLGGLAIALVVAGGAFVLRKGFGDDNTKVLVERASRRSEKPPLSPRPR